VEVHCEGMRGRPPPFRFSPSIERTTPLSPCRSPSSMRGLVAGCAPIILMDFTLKVARQAPTMTFLMSVLLERGLPTSIPVYPQATWKIPAASGSTALSAGEGSVRLRGHNERD